MEPPAEAGGIGSANNGDGTVTFTDLGSDTFSVTVSGASVTAHNGTYTTDTGANTLTGTLLTSSGPLCLVKPGIEISDDVGANSLADAGDTLAMEYPGLWIYDPDLGVPASPTYQWDRDASAISGETDAAGLLLTAPDQGTTITLDETYGGNTVTSTGITVETGSAMAADPSALLWYDPDNITVDGSNNVTTWSDNSGNGHHLTTVPTGLVAPVFSGGAVQLRASGPRALRSSGVGPIAAAFNAGDDVILWIVVSGAGNNQIDQVIFGENNNQAANQSTLFGIGEAAGIYQNYGHGREFSTAFGTRQSQANVTTSITATDKVLIRYEFRQASAAIYFDNVQERTFTVTTANLHTTSAKLTLGAQSADDGTNNDPADCNVFEIFATTDGSAPNIAAIEAELNTIHGL